MKTLIQTVLLCLLTSISYAQPIVLNDSKKSYPIFEYCTALEVKPGQRITIDSLLKQPDKYAFVPIDQKPVQPGTGRAYWFRVALTNPTTDNYFLRSLYMNAMVVRLYEVADNQVVNTGQFDIYGSSSPDLFQHSRGILPLTLQQGHTHTLYFYVPSMDTPKLDLGLMASPSLTKDVHYQDMFNGFNIGVALIIALYCLILGIRLRERDNLLFALASFVGLSVGFNIGGGFLEWPGNWPILLRGNYGIHSGGHVLFKLLFTFSFLQLRQQARWLYRIGVGLWVVLALATLTVLGVHLSGHPDGNLQLSLVYLTSLSVLLFNVVAGIVVSVRGYPPGLFFAFGQGVIILTLVLFSLGKIGVIPFSFWCRNAIDVGTFISTLSFLLGITYKVNQLKKKQDEAIRQQLRLTQENQQLVETQNQVLEEKVEQRTAELRASQAQLIQKEKLASLGELTAGIAHEIQNPLNFVNNFSEVSTELVEEQKEALAKGDWEEAGFIADDLAQNLQKITHHGSRASAIVRGMLEHSRTSTGEKQPTNLNALADEYLRLAYQVLRAKDNNGPTGRFNCELVTDFAAELPHIDVVPQDMGRVLLNLYNNAFYAVQERQKQPPTDQTYVPTVQVSTRQVGQTVEIRVRDNGMGIPGDIREKIFQPFFTTKPTGEGTGLGLSLSYDIITKGHGGTMTVESREGEGAEFIIHLPC